MPVYRRSEMIHIHIPKTGGTAIGRFFHKIGDMEWNRNSWVGEEFSENRWFEYQHLTMPELIDFTGDELVNFKSFAVVRNPYSRLVSEFRWRCQLHTQRPNPKIRSFASFKEFIHAIPQDINKNWVSYIKNAEKRDANFLIHVRPQHHYIFSTSGEQSVAVILGFERLKNDFDKLSNGIGLTNKIVQTTGNRNYMEYFDTETINIVNAIYFRDFELGSYPMI